MSRSTADFCKKRKGWAGTAPGEERLLPLLGEYIARRKQREILTLFGKIDYERTYDYKRERKGTRV
ncbi:MAG TPA: hypothetical protein VEG30_03070 [Terriglobales bacterium]|nr:hypothetical protein [Terriglobales bacterium]